MLSGLNHQQFFSSPFHGLTGQLFSFREVLGVIPVPAFSQWLGWPPGTISRGISALHRGPVRSSVSSRALGAFSVPSRSTWAPSKQSRIFQTS